jgi:hypothetical protein
MELANGFVLRAKPGQQGKQLNFFSLNKEFALGFQNRLVGKSLAIADEYFVPIIEKVDLIGIVDYFRNVRSEIWETKLEDCFGK